MRIGPAANSRGSCARCSGRLGRLRRHPPLTKKLRVRTFPVQVAQDNRLGIKRLRPLKRLAHPFEVGTDEGTNFCLQRQLDASAVLILLRLLFQYSASRRWTNRPADERLLSKGEGSEQATPQPCAFAGLISQPGLSESSRTSCNGKTVIFLFSTPGKWLPSVP